MFTETRCRTKKRPRMPHIGYSNSTLTDVGANDYVKCHCRISPTATFPMFGNESVMPLAPERLRYALPKPFFMPFAVAAINRLPSSKLLFRKVSPRRPTAQDPEDPGKHRAVIAPGSPRGRLLWRQERPHTLPVSLGKLGDQRCGVGANRCCRSRALRFDRCSFPPQSPSRGVAALGHCLVGSAPH